MTDAEFEVAMARLKRLIELQIEDCRKDREEARKRALEYQSKRQTATGQ